MGNGYDINKVTKMYKVAEKELSTTELYDLAILLLLKQGYDTRSIANQLHDRLKGNISNDDSIPEDFEWLITALGDPIRFKITQTLLDQKLTLSEIATTMELPESEIENHIKQLELGGVVQNVLSKNGSHYEMTRFGTHVCSGLVNLYNIYYGSIRD